MNKTVVENEINLEKKFLDFLNKFLFLNVHHFQLKTVLTRHFASFMILFKGLCKDHDFNEKIL